MHRYTEHGAELYGGVQIRLAAPAFPVCDRVPGSAEHFCKNGLSGSVLSSVLLKYSTEGGMNGFGLFSSARLSVVCIPDLLFLIIDGSFVFVLSIVTPIRK